MKNFRATRMAQRDHRALETRLEVVKLEQGHRAFLSSFQSLGVGHLRSGCGLGQSNSLQPRQFPENYGCWWLPLDRTCSSCGSELVLHPWSWIWEAQHRVYTWAPRTVQNNLHWFRNSLDWGRVGPQTPSKAAPNWINNEGPLRSIQIIEDSLKPVVPWQVPHLPQEWGTQRWLWRLSCPQTERCRSALWGWENWETSVQIPMLVEDNPKTEV